VIIKVVMLAMVMFVPVSAVLILMTSVIVVAVMNMVMDILMFSLEDRRKAQV
jgi:hypothetical protein